MKKKICLIMCMALIVTAFASVAFARKEQCSYCGTDMVCYDVSDEYVVRVYTSTCLNYSNRLDTMRVWGTDYFFKCPNRSCGSGVAIRTYFIARKGHGSKCCCDKNQTHKQAKFFLHDDPPIIT